ncbi:MAG: hypothetical protein V4496_00075 [Pseudomonadota bacterium]
MSQMNIIGFLRVFTENFDYNQALMITIENRERTKFNPFFLDCTQRVDKINEVMNILARTSLSIYNNMLPLISVYLIILSAHIVTPRFSHKNVMTFGAVALSTGFFAGFFSSFEKSKADKKTSTNFSHVGCAPK